MDMDLLQDLRFWAGTEEALAAYLLALRATLLDGANAGLVRPDNAEGEVTRSRLLSKVGDIGIIRIAGPLNNTDSWRNEYRDMTGYPEIRQALVEAAGDASMMAVMLDINSGGGAVSGVFDTAKLIQRVDKIKPVHSFSDGQMASAAYLLGSSARSVNIGHMTEVGSVGVLTVHQEMSKFMKEMGITPTVMRAGKFKALGNPFEPLSDTAREEIQAQLDYMYKVFVQHVADMRGVSYEVADKKLAQGRVFVGDNAKDIGLVDAVTSFDDLMSKIQGGIDSKKGQSKYPHNFSQGKLVSKQALTEQQIAALAVGGAPEAGATTVTTDEEAAAAQEAADKEAAEKAAAEAAEKEAAAETTETLAETVAGTQETTAESEVVAFLRGEISARDEKIVALTVELRDEKAKTEAVQATHAQMRAIAEASVGYLRVALGAAGADVKVMDDKQLLAEQAALQDTFNKKFKAGGVASVTPATPEKKGEQPVDSRRKARLQATRPQ